MYTFWVLAPGFAAPGPLLPPCGRLGRLMREGPSESSGEPGPRGLAVGA